MWLTNKHPFSFPYPRAKQGFTLVEMLVAIGVLFIMLLALFSILDTTTKTWRSTNSKVGEFSQLRNAMATMTERLGQATLNPYFDYDSLVAPKAYVRQSELRFISGLSSQVIDTPAATADPHYTHCVFFQAPLGMVSSTSNYYSLKNLLNTVGYFIEYSNNTQFLPSFLGGAGAVQHFRLMEMIETSDNLNIYQYTSGLDANSNPLTLSYLTSPALTGFSLNGAAGKNNGREWFLNSLYPANGNRAVHILADNVIALIILPKLSELKDPTHAALAPNYNWDTSGKNQSVATNPPLINPGDLNSVNQLPPILQVTLVAIDDATALRMTAKELADLQTLLNGSFTDATKYSTDLFIKDPTTGAANPNSLEQFLVTHKANYRILTSDIIIKEAKWSRY